MLPGLSGLSWHQSVAHYTVGLWLDPLLPSAHWFSVKTVRCITNSLLTQIILINIKSFFKQMAPPVPELPLGGRPARRLSSRDPVGF